MVICPNKFINNGCHNGFNRHTHKFLIVYTLLNMKGGGAATDGLEEKDTIYL